MVNTGARVKKKIQWRRFLLRRSVGRSGVWIWRNHQREKEEGRQRAFGRALAEEEEEEEEAKKGSFRVRQVQFARSQLIVKILF